MNELTLIKTTWSPKTKRITQLIVPEITYSNRQGSLNNHSWAFNVEYAFRAALDIKYEQRMKNKRPYMVWTQGPILSFKSGDTLHARNNSSTLQVVIAKPMSWDNENNHMYEGYVEFNRYIREENSLVLSSKYTCSQMEFLEILIDGNIDIAKPYIPEYDAYEN